MSTTVVPVRSVLISHCQFDALTHHPLPYDDSNLGYPILCHFLKKPQTTQGGFNLGGTNATGQIAALPGNFGLIDLDTPQSAYTKASFQNPDNGGEELELVFSDEFNRDGRTFYPGDDPYWEAADLHYWQTVRYSWSSL